MNPKDDRRAANDGIAPHVDSQPPRAIGRFLHPQPRRLSFAFTRPARARRKLRLGDHLLAGDSRRLAESSPPPARTAASRVDHPAPGSPQPPPRHERLVSCNAPIFLSPWRSPSGHPAQRRPHRSRNRPPCSCPPLHHRCAPVRYVPRRVGPRQIRVPPPPPTNVLPRRRQVPLITKRSASGPFDGRRRVSVRLA